MRLIRNLMIGSWLFTHLIYANESSLNIDSQKNELSNPKETRELKTPSKPVKKKKSKQPVENPNSQNSELEDAPPAPPIY